MSNGLQSQCSAAICWTLYWQVSRPPSFLISTSSSFDTKSKHTLKMTQHVYRVTVSETASPQERIATDLGSHSANLSMDLVVSIKRPEHSLIMLGLIPFLVRNADHHNCGTGSWLRGRGGMHPVHGPSCTPVVQGPRGWSPPEAVDHT